NAGRRKSPRIRTVLIIRMTIRMTTGRIGKGRLSRGIKPATNGTAVEVRGSRTILGATLGVTTPMAVVAGATREETMEAGNMAISHGTRATAAIVAAEIGDSRMAPMAGRATGVAVMIVVGRRMSGDNGSALVAILGTDGSADDRVERKTISKRILIIHH
ncbi:hypothetical protein FOZ62_018302, partial [Perkinsus olseni]